MKEHKPYHHGNLEEALIEAGIRIINREGAEHFSLRKAAAACGVSHAAPYKHFRDRDDMLTAMRNHIADRFAAELETALPEKRSSADSMISLARGYLRFFMNNPHSFAFFQSQSVGDVNLSDLSEVSDFRPFEIFKKTALARMEEERVPQHLHVSVLITMWGIVHGITSIAVMKGVRCGESWEELLIFILEKNIHIQGSS